jgi:hypothetical protein
LIIGGHRVIIFGFLPQNLKTRRVAVAFSMAWREAGVGGDQELGLLAAFRGELYRCLTARADALFELADGAPRGAVVPDGGERPSISPPS